MKKILLTILATGLCATPAFAEKDHDHDHHDHGHVEHYSAQEIKTKEDALKTLDKKVAEVAQILKAEKLSDVEMEKIHEISYTLEASVDKINAEKAAPQEAIDALDEAVQAIHYASEEHEEAKTREWFAKLEPAAGNIKGDKEALKTRATKEIFEIVIKDHKFEPAEITVPAGQRIKLLVDNQDPTPEEFESHDMNREKIIAGNSKATIFVGPLKPGKYHYFGEFNMDSANGYIIAE